MDMRGRHGNHARGERCSLYRHGEVKHIGGRRVASPEYNTWQAVKNRVLNPKADDYHYYGGRGVTMDPAWQEDFMNFLADMGRRPGPGFTIERLDVNGPYNKENCVWATRKAQARNRNYCTLDLPQANAIRSLYATGKFTQKTLAYYFGVSQVLISRVVRNLNWS